MAQCYYNHGKNKLEVNFIDSCDFDLLCIEIYAEEASCDASFVLPFTLHLKDENEKGDLDYE